jgi:ABC-type lipoprotein release transport system permease subunit
MAADRDRLDAPLARLRAAAPALDVQPWTVLEPLLVVTASITEVMLYIWFAIVFLAMSFGLVNTLLMAVFERTREFGLIQSLGMQPRDMLGQVLVESLMLLVWPYDRQRAGRRRTSPGSATASTCPPSPRAWRWSA